MKFGKCSTCGFTTALLDFKNPEDYRCPNDGTPLSTTTVELVIPVRDDILKYLRPSGAQIEDDRVGNAILGYIQKHLGVFWFNNDWFSGPLCTEVGGSGSVTYSGGKYYVRLGTGTTLDSYAHVNKAAMGLSRGFSWDKKRHFGVAVYLWTYSAQNVHITTGTAPTTGSENLPCHIGFKVIDDVIYGTVGSAAEVESVLALETLAAAAFRRLECVFTPCVECRIYIEGADKGSITTNLPTGTDYAEGMLYVSVHNTAAANKYLDIYEARTFQEE